MGLGFSKNEEEHIDNNEKNVNQVKDDEDTIGSSVLNDLEVEKKEIPKVNENENENVNKQEKLNYQKDPQTESFEDSENEQKQEKEQEKEPQNILGGMNNKKRYTKYDLFKILKEIDSDFQKGGEDNDELEDTTLNDEKSMEHIKNIILKELETLKKK